MSFRIEIVEVDPRVPYQYVVARGSTVVFASPRRWTKAASALAMAARVVESVQRKYWDNNCGDPEPHLWRAIEDTLADNREW